MYNHSCNKCELSTLSNRTVCLPGRGNPNADILIIGDAPDHRDNTAQVPFADPQIQQVFARCGITEANAFFTYAVKCMPPHQGRAGKRRDINGKHRRACLSYLLSEAESIRPRIAVCLGLDAFKCFFPYAVNISEYRGRILPSKNFGAVTVTYKPTYVYHNRAFEEMLQRDFKIVHEYLRTGTVEVKEYGSQSIITDDESVIQEFIQHAFTIGRCASDVETSGLDHWSNKFQVTHAGFYSGGKGICFDPRFHQEAYHKLLELEQIVHNAGFEGSIYPSGCRITRDTQILSHLFNPFLPTRLEERANIHLGNIRWKGNESTWTDWAKRNIIDTEVTWRLDEFLWENLDEKRHKLHDNIVLPAAIIYGGITARGVRVDTHHQYELNLELEKEAAEIHQHVVEAYSFPRDGNLNSAPQVSDFLYKKLKLPIPPQALKELGDPSTSADILAELALLYPVCAKVREYRHVKKLSSNYIWRDSDGGYKHLIHPRYNVCGTVTGRPSSGKSRDEYKDPPFQTLSNEARIRRSIVPKKKIFVQGDLKQVELVIATRFSGDPVLTDAFITGKDIHYLTAVMMNGGGEFDKKTPEGKERRRKAKPPNFLTVYGGHWKLIQLGALKDYGIVFSDLEASDVQIGWFNLYAGIKRWHQKVYREILLDPRRESPFGRVWVISEAQSRDNKVINQAHRKALNYPTQGSGSDCNLLGLLELDKMDSDAACATVHDSVVADLDATEAEAIEFARVWKQNWEASIQEWWPHEVPIKVDMSVGYSLGDLKEIDFV